jgi:hypothetical protein
MKKSGYTEIVINNITVGIKFNMYGFERMQEIKGNIASGSRYAASLIYGGMLGNCYAKQIEPPDISFEEISDYVDMLAATGDPDSILSKLNDIFNSSEFIKALNERQNGISDEELKKKIVEAV